MKNSTPLTFEIRDEFNRKDTAEKLIKLLSSEVSVSPLVIDGSWGLGKTEFCQKLINLMATKESHHLIYIDAFKADHADEPLLTILAKILEVVPTKEDQKNLIQKAIPALRYSLKLGAKAFVSHLLRQDTDSVLEGFDKEIQEAADKAIDSSVESLLKEHIEAEKNLETLKETLKTIAEEKPIILFIDELDRCRPDFAVLMLETIKHTFDVENVQFVLVTNMQQLKASINNCYGDAIDSQRYLDKFLKFTFTLSSRKEANFEGATLAATIHYSNLVNQSSILKDLELDRNACFFLVEQVIKINNLSLREVETFIRYLEIYQTIQDGTPLANNVAWAYKLVRVLGVLLVSLRPDLANSATKNNLDANDLGAFIGINEFPSWDGDSFQRPTYAEVLMVMLGSECQVNNKLWQTEDEILAKTWESLIHSYFRDCRWAPAKGERMNIVTDVIRTLGLLS